MQPDEYWQKIQVWGYLVYHFASPYVSIEWASCNSGLTTSQVSHDALVMVAPKEQWAIQAFQDENADLSTDIHSNHDGKHIDK